MRATATALRQASEVRLAAGMMPLRTKENCQGWVTTAQIVEG
jgi:hypothetical protein